jgi:hypothetical protein
MLIIIAVIGLVANTNAQAPVFVMSSIGSMGTASSSVSAINYKSTATCLDVQNGIAVLSGKRNTGDFAMNCEVTMKYNTLGVKLFPNPVNASTKVKFVNAPPLNEVFNLSIWNTDGGIVSTRKENGYNLFQGLTMDLSGLTPGSYVLKIESSSFVDAIKFIKGN